MEKYKVFKTVKKSTLPKKAKVLSSIWAMKKKSNGTYRAGVTARAYKQANGIHNDEDSKVTPVVNEAMILITFVLMLLAGLVGYIVDVNSAFLHGHFEEKHKMYLSVPKGFKKYHGSDVVLLLQQTLDGTKTGSVSVLARIAQRCSTSRARPIHVYFSSRIKKRNLVFGYHG
jgi:Reverse transcriptase (RNA-dependent DNA polymerase)